MLAPALRAPLANRAPVGTALEVARQRLRRGQRLEAAELLDRCIEALAKDHLDDPALAERRAYAHDRSTGNGRSCLPPDVLQRVITWLTREELDEGERELAADRPFAAARCFSAADAIDGRGSRSAFLHAVALHRAAQKAVQRAAAEPEGATTATDFAEASASGAAAHFLRAERCLRRAAALVRWAHPDPEWRLPAEQLAATIRAALAGLQKRQEAANRMATACSCLVDYEALVQHHRASLPLEPAAQVRLRSSVAKLTTRITTALTGSPPGSAEHRLLITLADGVTELRNSLA